MNLTFTFNGKVVDLEDIPGEVSLLEVIREHLGMLGTKEGCGVGECGACSVLLDGRVVNSCLTAAWQAAGREIVTIEGLASSGELHPLQQAFVDTGAVQCGFCIPGMIMTAHNLLQDNPNPSVEDIKKALEGNLCRCTGYHDIIRAVRQAARRLRGEAS